MAALLDTSQTGAFVPNSGIRPPVEQHFIAFVSADSDLIGLAGTRIYPGVAPDKTERPYIVWFLVSGSTDYTHDGAADEEYRLQFSVFADTYIQAATIRDVLLAKLSGYRGPMPLRQVDENGETVTPSELDDVLVLHQGTRHTYEPTTKLHHVSVDFTFTL